MLNGRLLRYMAVLIACLLSLPAAGGIYKWVDQDGNVHFSDRPPKPAGGGEVSEQALPKYLVPKGTSNPSTPQSTLDVESPAAPESGALGRLPDNTKSEYLETRVAGFVVDTKKPSARYNLVLAAKRGLPFGAVLDSTFENPADRTNRLTTTTRRSGASDRISIVSPDFWPMKCGNFLVEVSIYRNTLRSELLGIHKQQVQSRIDADKARSRFELIEALLKGNCP